MPEAMRTPWIALPKEACYFDRLGLPNVEIGCGHALLPVLWDGSLGARHVLHALRTADRFRNRAAGGAAGRGECSGHASAEHRRNPRRLDQARHEALEDAAAA